LKIPKGGNQNSYIEEEQTTQWSNDTKGRQSEFVHRRRTDNTMAERKKYKTTNNDLQNIHIKRVTRTPLKTEGELGCSGTVSRSCTTSDTRRINLVINPVISHE
jgi:hypothetical protein